MHSGLHSSRDRGPHRCRAGAHRRGCRQPARPLARRARLPSRPRHPPPRRPPPDPRRRRPPRRRACVAATQRRGSPASPPPMRRSRLCCGAHMPYAKAARLRPPRPLPPPRRLRPDRLERRRCRQQRRRRREPRRRRRPPQAAPPRTRMPQQRSRVAGRTAARARGWDDLDRRAAPSGRLCARRRPPRSAAGAARAALSACAQNRLSWPPGRAAQLRGRLRAAVRCSAAGSYTARPAQAGAAARPVGRHRHGRLPCAAPSAGGPACAASPLPAATSRGCGNGGARGRSALRTCAGPVCSKKLMMRRTSCWHRSARRRRAPHPQASETPPTRAAGAPADRRISPRLRRCPGPSPRLTLLVDAQKTEMCLPVLCRQRIELQRCMVRPQCSRRPRQTARHTRCHAPHSCCNVRDAEEARLASCA